MARTYLKIFFDFEQRAAALTAEEQGRLLLALLHYASSGEKDQLLGNERFLFPTFCMDIDRDMEVYEAKVAGGKQGGRPKKENHRKPEETTDNHGKPEETSFKNKNKEEEKEKEYEEENEYEKEKECKKEKGADALSTLSSLFSQYSFSPVLHSKLCETRFFGGSCRAGACSRRYIPAVVSPPYRYRSEGTVYHIDGG